MDSAVGSHGGMVLSQAVPGRPARYFRPTAPQRRLRHALQQTLRRRLPVPAAGCRDCGPHRDRTDGAGLQGPAQNSLRGGAQDGPSAPAAVHDRGVDRRPRLSLQLFGNGLHAGSGPGSSRMAVSAGQRLPRLDGVLSERQ